jgi:hypothetical protein
VDGGARAVLRDSVAGALEVADSTEGVTPWRLPASTCRYAPPALALMAEFTSGVRLRLRTDADRLELDASLVRLAMRHLGAPAAPARLVVCDRGRDIAVEVDETGVVVETADRRFERGPARRSTIGVDLDPADAPRDLVVWLPHDAGITVHDLRATRAGVPTEVAPSSAASRPRWLHHGSSISHGGNATLPTGTWPVRAAAALGVDVVNLGFGGNAMLDPLTAQAIAAADADVITVKIGINIVGADAMRRRTFVPALHGFLDRIREGHPEAPIVVISAIGCPALEHTPGPLAVGADGRIAGTPRSILPGDGTLTLEVSRELVADVVADRSADDPALGFLDGRRLLAPEEADRLPDGLHPDDAGYALIAERFVAFARDTREPLGAAFAAAERF